MVRRGQRRIDSKTARAMCTWSHYRFQQHLIHKAREYPWCRVVICTEEYTSKTCGFCGYIHKKLGGLAVPNVKQSLIEILMVLAIFFFDILQKRSQLRLTREHSLLFLI